MSVSGLMMPQKEARESMSSYGSFLSRLLLFQELHKKELARPFSCMTKGRRKKKVWTVLLLILRPLGGAVCASIHLH